MKKTLFSIALLISNFASANSWNWVNFLYNNGGTPSAAYVVVHYQICTYRSPQVNCNPTIYTKKINAGGVEFDSGVTNKDFMAVTDATTYTANGSKVLSAKFEISNQGCFTWESLGPNIHIVNGYNGNNSSYFLRCYADS